MFPTKSNYHLVLSISRNRHPVLSMTSKKELVLLHLKNICRLPQHAWQKQTTIFCLEWDRKLLNRHSLLPGLLTWSRALWPTHILLGKRQHCVSLVCHLTVQLENSQTSRLLRSNCDSCKENAKLSAEEKKRCTFSTTPSKNPAVLHEGGHFPYPTTQKRC